MQDFTRPSGRLRALPLGARAVYSVFLVFTLVGLALTLWLTHDMVGLDLSDAEQPPSAIARITMVRRATRAV